MHWDVNTLAMVVTSSGVLKAYKDSHLSIECIFCEVLNLLLKAAKKFFYLLVNSFGAETIWVESQRNSASLSIKA